MSNSKLTLVAFVICISFGLLMASNVSAETVREVDSVTGSTQYHKPALKREGQKVYEVRDGRVQYGKPAYVLDKGVWRSTYPGTNRIDYNRPGFKPE